MPWFRKPLNCLFVLERWHGVLLLVIVLAVLGVVGYQTIFPVDVARINEITVLGGPYSPGDLVRYEVSVDKYYALPALVHREVRCNNGTYNIIPDQRGEAALGAGTVYKRYLLLPDEVQAPDTCTLRMVFTYEDPRGWHAPWRYEGISNTFQVVS